MKGSIMVLDFGTTALKVVLFDNEYHIAYTSSREFQYEYPNAGWIELRPDVYIQYALDLMREAIEYTSSQDSLEAITVTGQAETIITVGADGQAFGKAMVWLDTRAEAEASKLDKTIPGKKLYETTGLTVHDPILPLLKIRWVKRNEPDRYQKAVKILMLKEYILYYLTGEFIAEYSVSSCTGYFDIINKRWDESLLEAAGIDAEKMPDVAPPSALIGALDEPIAKKIGVTRPVNVLNGMLDQCAAAIGCGNWQEGIISETTGTCMAIAATLDSLLPFSNRLTPVLCHGIKDKYLALPYCPTAGIVLKWVKDNFFHFDSQDKRDPYQIITETLIKRGFVENKLIALPHFCGYLSPVNNPEATGVFYGMTLGLDAFDFARAIMEGISFLLRENTEQLNLQGITAEKVISMGGGAKSLFWLQMKSDVVHVPIVTLVNGEATALGAALGAALELGMLSDEKDMEKYVLFDKTYYPDTSKLVYYDKKYDLYRDINRKLGFYK